MPRVLPLLLLIATCSLAAADSSRDKAIAIATDEVRSFRDVDLASLKISPERRTEPPDDVLPSDRPRLTHRAFWFVSFSPRKIQLGGGYAVYVAADSGQILGSRGYR